MTKIAVCYFSYWKDKDFLNNSLKCLYNTIEKFKGSHEVKVYVFDDGRCDKRLKKKELYGSPTLITTSFDRKGNLNGFDCMDGMFREYKKILEKFDFDYLIKLDSDCVLNSFDYIKVAEKELTKIKVPKERIGEMGSYFAQICIVGCCQTFGKMGINAINNLFSLMQEGKTNDAKILKKRVAMGYNEDKVISVLMEMSPLLKINIDTLPDIKGNCNAFVMENNTDYSSYTSVAFKPNYFLRNSNWTREKSLEVMSKYVNDIKIHG